MRKRRKRGGGTRWAAALGAALCIGAAALCASDVADGAVDSGTAKVIARRENLAPVAVIGVTPEPDLSQLETVACREPVQPYEPVERYYLDDEARDYVARVVMAEAGAEDFDGQCLVAQCILDTMLARDMSAVAVVREPKQYAAPAAEASESVKAAVDAVFWQGYRVTSEPVRYFYAPKICHSAWHETNLVFVLEHGGHRFFKEG